jgi:D-arabinose 1-dehydrogenase-like Zn-dependent alcohol dehydrogenase
MKAFVLSEYGKHYQLSELEKPVPGKSEVLI